ncbi:MAG TPA: tripartite tricarboxylate transporter substrate-binding protein [Aestuariivirgaceae bacterium]|jgi:putative tricarboxylic transport membrane protein|nr:tripartite tricarboxylate transporter substrate-binding protein [Aestuariivirgaceae bacterium]
MSLMRKLVGGASLVLAGLLWFQPGVTPAHSQDWMPEKPVELVIMAGKGGGADKMARMFKQIIDDNQMSPVPFEPVNMPGENGAEALKHLEANSGSTNIVMVTLNSFYTTPLQNSEIKAKITDFAPIARMAEDTFVLWVNKNSGIDTLEKFAAAAKKKGKDWVMAGTGTASEDNLLTIFLNEEFGLSMSYRAFEGGGEVAKELAAGKCDSTVNNPSEQEDIYLDGKTTPVSAFTPERLDQFENVPTFREKGHDMVYFMQRSVVGPPNMPPEALEFYRNLFREVYESKEWQDYMNRNSLRGEFITGDTLVDYWSKEQGAHKKILAAMGKTN